MRLTREKELKFCIRLWTWLAKTGKGKEEYKYKKEELEYCIPVGSHPLYGCWFCEYTHQNGGHIPYRCPKCRYKKKYGHCESKDNPFIRWAQNYDPKIRKKYAKLFLEQIKSLKG